MAAVHRHGFTRLSGGGTSDDQPSLNIIFVHGLRGHPRETWETAAATGERRSDVTKKHRSLKSWFQRPRAASPSTSTEQAYASSPSPSSSSVFWPEQYLAPDIPQARVWTYGYNADVIGGLFQANNKNSISQHGQDLSVRLERDIDNNQPIAFVVHSLGGIIVKDAIRRSEKIRERTKLIIFLGTPHRGSTYAGWGEIASNLVRLALQDSNKKMLETLDVKSEVLNIIHEEFKTIVSNGGIKIHSFQEARGISGMKGLDEKVVDDFSSKLDLSRTLETVESIDANHMQMARYSSKDDQGYRAISGVLKATIREGMDRGSPAHHIQNKTLQPHAAGAAAAYAEIPTAIRPTDVAKTRTAEEAIRSTSKHVVTPTYCIPFPKNRYFVGRKTELDALKQKLMVNQLCQKMSVVGLGGTGKTQIALQFAYIVKETWPECSIFWIPALSFESFEQACADIARELHLPQQAGGEEDVKELVCQHLSSPRAGRWLLVLDNADDSDIVFGTAGSKGIVDYLPESEEGLMVYTTRIQDVAVSLTRGDVLELGAMNRRDAGDFLEKTLVRKDLCDKAAIEELLDELTCLPLAIAQAAAYLNRNRMSIAKYLHLLRNTEQDVVGLMSREFRDDTRYKSSANAVATTWVVSFSQIRAHDAVAADLLAFTSCVEWKAIPRSLLPSVQPEERMEEAIGTLRGYSFLARRGDDEREAGEGGDEEDEEWYDMHRLVHLATTVWIGRHGDAAEEMEKATRHVAKVFPTDDFANRAVWRAYLPHALRLLENRQDSDVKEKSKLCLWVGRCLRVDGRIREAVRWLEECCRLRNKLGEEDSDRLFSQHELATVYEADGQVKKAVELLEHVVAVREKVLAEEHPNQLASQHALAIAYRADGQVKKAVELLEHVVAVREKVQAEERPDRLASQHELARAYREDGQVKRAVGLLEHVVAVGEKMLAEEHPDRLASQHELARAYEADGQVKKAVELLEHVVAVREKVLAEEHPDRLASQHVLAGAYRADGQVKKAVGLLEHVVTVEESWRKSTQTDLRRSTSSHEHTTQTDR